VTAYVLRILIVAGLGLLIWLGLRKIWRDWSRQFRAEDEEKRQIRRERDRREREQPGVIDLKRDADGTYRPDEDNNRR